MRLSQDKWGSRGFSERGRFGRWAEGWAILIRLFHRDTHGYIPCQKYIIVNVEGNHRLSQSAFLKHSSLQGLNDCGHQKHSKGNGQRVHSCQNWII